MVADNSEKCVWKHYIYDEDELWETGCGYEEELPDNLPPEEQGFYYCPLCGKRIETVYIK